MDAELTKLARNHGCFYTRYADDITFSSHRSRLPAALVELPLGQRSGSATGGAELDAVIQSNGFSLNPSKTRVLSRADSQEVCGIVCNVRLNPRRDVRREVRGMIHAWRKWGYANAEKVWDQQHNWRRAKSFERSLRGKLQYLAHIRGEDDAVVNSLVQQFNELPGRTFRPINYEFRGGWKDNLHKTVCVVESGDDVALEYKQGSGFLLPNGFILTNAHNVMINGVVAPDLIVRFQDHLSVDIEVELVQADAGVDYAILKPKEGMWQTALSSNSCQLSFSRPLKGDAIWVAGFPNYHKGDPVQINVGQVLSSRLYDGVDHFRVSTMINKGNSGGPVFDQDGKVVGMASKGVDTSDVVNMQQNGSLYLADLSTVILPFII
jgi:S1-C subfamily serine protease